MRESLRKGIGRIALVAGATAMGLGAGSLLYDFVKSMSSKIKPSVRTEATLEDYCASRERTTHLEEVGGIGSRSYELRVHRPKIYHHSFLIRPSPYAGKSIELLVQPYASSYNIPLIAVSLYEDDKLIEEKKVVGNDDLISPEVSFEVNHNSAGEHTYIAEVVDACGSKARSVAKTIKFSGSTEDFPPRIGAEHALGFGVGVGDRTLFVDAYDIGDNRGLDKIIIYEDRKPIASYDGKKGSYIRIEFPIVELRGSVLTGTHSYSAEAIDISGQAFRTAEIDVTFKGK